MSFWGEEEEASTVSWIRQTDGKGIMVVVQSARSSSCILES